MPEALDHRLLHPATAGSYNPFSNGLSGRFDLVLDGREAVATAGDFVRMPMGIPHGTFNKSEQSAECIFWVSPTRKLYDLSNKIHNLTDPNEVVRIAGEHEVDFLPPPK